jgi:SpoVK/Ycf46/Vps4 family AAA+-type ATPase
MKIDQFIQVAKAGLTGETETIKTAILQAAAEAKKHRRYSVADRLENLYRWTPHRHTAAQTSQMVPLSKAQCENLVCAPPIDMKDVYLGPEEKDFVSQISKEWQARQRLSDHRIHPRNRLLFSGTTGCGKTTLAHVIGHELGLPVYRMEHTIVDSHLGVTQSAIGDVFNWVSQNSPCVLLIDEFDSFGAQRGSEGSTTREMARLVNALLTFMDSLSQDVLLICTTNMVEILDPAVKRRFDIVSEFPSPTTESLELVASKILDSRDLSQAFADIRAEISKSTTRAQAARIAKDYVREILIKGF